LAVDIDARLWRAPPPSCVDNLRRTRPGNANSLPARQSSRITVVRQLKTADAQEISSRLDRYVQRVVRLHRAWAQCPYAVGTPVDERRTGREPPRFEPRIWIWRLAGVESSHSLRPVRMVG